MVSIFFIIASVLIFQSDNISTKPVGWEESFTVSTYGMTTKNIHVAGEGNFIAVVYEAVTGNKEGIYISISFNGGLDFIKPVRIAESDPKVENKPHVAVSGKSLITVAWQDFVEKYSANRIFLSTSQNLGASWSEVKNVTFGYEIEMLPMVHYDDKNRLHIFYHGFKDNLFNLYHAYDTGKEGFKTTGALITLKEQMKGAFFPAVYFKEKKIFVVWQGRGSDLTDQLYFISSGNYGSSWSNAEQITATKGSNIAPSIMMKDDTLYVAYQNNDEKTWGIKMLAGKNYGRNWEDNVIRVSDTNVNCYSPHIVGADKEIAVVWYDLREREPHVFLRRYSLIDGSLTETVKLSERKYSARNPNIVFSDNKIVVIWEEQGKVLAKYNDVVVRPPRVFSRTHPENIWTRRSRAVIEWETPKDESGIAGYLVAVNKLADFNPPDIVRTKATSTRKVLTEMEDGVTYFHIRTVDGAGNLSRTVHYKIQVSSNPPPMPLVISPTHKENVETDSNAPIFRWAVDDVDRLKGFYYSVKQGGIGDLNKFTPSFELRLKDLEMGGYFFSISSVDKTNQVGPPATYYFIVGKADKIDIDKIKNIAKGVSPAIKKLTAKRPGVSIILPFETKASYNGDDFTASIAVKNLEPQEIVGFSVYSGTKKLPVSKEVSTTSQSISISGLDSGPYYIGVRCQYYKIVKGKKQYYWTGPVYRSFNVELPYVFNPFEYYINMLVKKLTEKVLYVSAMVLLLLVLTGLIGFGNKLVFYLRLFQFKCVSMFRVILNREYI